MPRKKREGGKAAAEEKEEDAANARKKHVEGQNKEEEEEEQLPADIVLKEYACPADLEKFGLDRLKEELQKRGLKCGGNVQERAARLFLLRDKKVSEIDKKHLAKK